MEDVKGKAKILVVDDEEDICEILQYNLEKAGYLVKTVMSAEDALSTISDEKFDLLMLDIMLGGISGLRLAQLLREDYKSTIPIIFVTALDTETDILKGFKTGGDDYVSKPFSINEVVARVGAVLARCGIRKEMPTSSTSWNRSAESGTVASAPAKESKREEPNEYNFGVLNIYPSDKRVTVEGEEVFLTKKEMEILMLLARSAGHVFSREDILRLVWKDDGYVLQRTVDVHIARLRKKLGKAGDLILNRSGYGYSLVTK